MLRLTINEANEIRENIQSKEKKLKELRLQKGTAYEDEGDGFHDNFAFEQAEIMERRILREIADLRTKLDEAQIIDLNVEAENANGNVVIGSEVTVQLEFDGERDEETYTITGGFGNISQNIVSVESPLGKCLMGKAVGFEGEYTVNGVTTLVKIVKIA